MQLSFHLAIFAASLPLTLSAQAQASTATRTPSIAGQVLDQRGGVIRAAKVTIRSSAGAERSTDTNQEGRFSFFEIPPGNATVRVLSKDFAPYEQTVKIDAGAAVELKVSLQIAPRKEEVVIMSTNPLFKGLEYQGGAIILSGQALESLPDGPGGLEAVLRALAVRTAGPFGPQIVVNGFEDNPGLPLTHSIREIRINDNPFSAEYWKLGLGRIEVLTKPGEDKFHSEVFFNYGDGNVNSRNSFASNRAPYQSRFFGGNIS